MRSRTELRERANALSADLLLIDTEMALTLLNLADTTRSRESRMRRRKEARKAYETILRLLPKVEMTDKQRAAIEQGLGSLHRRLLRVG